MLKRTTRTNKESVEGDHAFREEFEHGFGSSCSVIGPPEAVAEAVLAHEPLSIAETVLHIEWMTQRHYVESVKDNGDLDPQF